MGMPDGKATKSPQHHPCVESAGALERVDLARKCNEDVGEQNTNEIDVDWSNRNDLNGQANLPEHYHYDDRMRGSHTMRFRWRRRSSSLATTTASPSSAIRSPDHMRVHGAAQVRM